MPKIINKRIYMECELHDESYFKELNKIIELALDKYLIIWDQSILEGNNEEKLFDIYLSPNKSNEGGIKIFDRRIWASLVQKNINRAKYIQIGCWKSESALIEEINYACEVLRFEEYGEQIEFFIEIDDDSVVNYLIKDFLDADGNIKWFNVVLYFSNNEEQPFFISNHCGEEIIIQKLTAEAVEEMISSLENNDIYIRINKHNSEI